MLVLYYYSGRINNDDNSILNSLTQIKNHAFYFKRLHLYRSIPNLYLYKRVEVTR